MIDLLAEPDLDWIADAVDIVVRNAGRPWRTALEQLDDLERATIAGADARAPRPDQGSTAYHHALTTRYRFRAVVGALQRVTGGKLRNARAARRVRGLVLGHPTLDPTERQGRIAHAAMVLGTTPQQVETMLWSDLPRERPVELASGRPLELEVAAFANVALIQRAMRRAQSLALRLCDDDAGHLVRAAATRGLLVTSTLGAGGTILVEMAGPLALCHRTSVYGRALGELVPLLAELRDWALEIRIELPLASFSKHISSPVLLPAPPARLAAPPAPLARLCRGLERATRSTGWPLVLTPSPPPLRAGDSLLWPDLEVDDGSRRTYVELVGFWTRDHLARKLAAYRESGHEVILCVDRARAAEQAPLPPEVVAYTRQLGAEAVLQRLRPS